MHNYTDVEVVKVHRAKSVKGGALVKVRTSHEQNIPFKIVPFFFFFIKNSNEALTYGHFKSAASLGFFSLLAITSSVNFSSKRSING